MAVVCLHSRHPSSGDATRVRGPLEPAPTSFVRPRVSRPLVEPAIRATVAHARKEAQARADGTWSESGGFTTVTFPHVQPHPPADITSHPPLRSDFMAAGGSLLLVDWRTGDALVVAGAAFCDASCCASTTITSAGGASSGGGCCAAGPKSLIAPAGC